LEFWWGEAEESFLSLPFYPTGVGLFGKKVGCREGVLRGFFGNNRLHFKTSRAKLLTKPRRTRICDPPEAGRQVGGFGT